jgi:hypothetical protein
MTRTVVILALIPWVASAQTFPKTTAERTNYAQTSTSADVGAFLDSLQMAGAPIAVDVCA